MPLALELQTSCSVLAQLVASFEVEAILPYCYRGNDQAETSSKKEGMRGVSPARMNAFTYNYTDNKVFLKRVYLPSC
jgi:hypothetical protein